MHVHDKGRAQPRSVGKRIETEGEASTPCGALAFSTHPGTPAGPVDLPDLTLLATDRGQLRQGSAIDRYPTRGDGNLSSIAGAQGGRLERDRVNRGEVTMRFVCDRRPEAISIATSPHGSLNRSWVC